MKLTHVQTSWQLPEDDESDDGSGSSHKLSKQSFWRLLFLLISNIKYDTVRRCVDNNIKCNFVTKYISSLKNTNVMFCMSRLSETKWWSAEINIWIHLTCTQLNNNYEFVLTIVISCTFINLPIWEFHDHLPMFWCLTPISSDEVWRRGSRTSLLQSAIFYFNLTIQISNN